MHYSDRSGNGPVVGEPCGASPRLARAPRHPSRATSPTFGKFPKSAENTHPRNTSPQHIPATHPRNTSPQHIPATHPRNTSPQHMPPTHAPITPPRNTRSRNVRLGNKRVCDVSLGITTPHNARPRNIRPGECRVAYSPHPQGQRPGRLPSPAHRAGLRTHSISVGPTARPFVFGPGNARKPGDDASANDRAVGPRECWCQPTQPDGLG